MRDIKIILQGKTTKVMVTRVTIRIRNQAVILEAEPVLTHLAESIKIETLTLMVASMSSLPIFNPVSRRTSQSMDVATTPEVLVVLASRTKKPRRIVQVATGCLRMNVTALSLALAWLTNLVMKIHTLPSLSKDDMFMDK
jgi:hypothetical protein